MTQASPSTGLQLRSTVKKDGILELSLARVPTPEPKPEEPAGDVPELEASVPKRISA